MKNKGWKNLIYSIFILGVLCLVYSYFEARNIQYRIYTFSHPDIPSSFSGTKIIFLADTHCNAYFGKKEMRTLVKTINEANPDIVLLGGDMVSRDSIYLDNYFSEIKHIQSKHGVYYVFGNHDYWEDVAVIQQGLDSIKFLSCNNQSYWIRQGSDSLKIGGVDDLWEGKQILDSTIHDVSVKDFCLLMTHNPDYVESVDTSLVDLVLAGHTHAGQITFFGLWAPVMPGTLHSTYIPTKREYRYGWIDDLGTTMYVTSGAGVGEFPLRFFARPEIVEITLQAK